MFRESSDGEIPSYRGAVEGLRMITRVLSMSLAALLLAASAWPRAAAAVEYRLQVASLYDEAFYALLGRAGTRREGPVRGRSRLIEALDTAEAPAAVLLYDRPLEAARAPVATAFRAARVRGEGPPSHESKPLWGEARWNGNSGEHSVWVIAPSSSRYTQVRNVALKGRGPLVWAIPHRIAFSQPPAKALGIPLGFLQAHEGNPALWETHLSTTLDMTDGVTVVVGEHSSSAFADHVFIIIKHAASPTTYRVVLGWARRAHEIQAP